MKAIIRINDSIMPEELYLQFLDIHFNNRNLSTLHSDNLNSALVIYTKHENKDRCEMIKSEINSRLIERRKGLN